MTPKNLSDRLAVLLAEYSSMRSEILQISTKQQNLLIASFAVVSYGFTYIISKQGDANQGTIEPHMWLALSAVLSALGLLFCDCDRAIIRNATYIEGFLKVEMTRLLMGPFSPSDPKLSLATDSKAREEFNRKVEAYDEKTAAFLLPTRDIQTIINQGSKSPSQRPAEDCRLLEWECYIRGNNYMQHHLEDFPEAPNNAHRQGSLIFIPAAICWALFFYYATQPAILQAQQTQPIITQTQQAQPAICQAQQSQPVICQPQQNQPIVSQAQQMLGTKQMLSTRLQITIFFAEGILGIALLGYLYKRLYKVVRAQRLEIPQPKP